MPRGVLAAVLILLVTSACTGGTPSLAGPTPSSSPTPASPTATSPAVAAHPAVTRKPRIQYTLDATSRADGTAAVLGQTCFTDSSCITWVRWSTDAGRTFPRHTQQTVLVEPPPTDGEPEGSTLNRIRLGPAGTAWVWAAGQPDDSPQLLYTTADHGRTWENSGEAGYRDVQPWGNSAWVLLGVCHSAPLRPGCTSTLNTAPAGTNPYATGKQLTLPASTGHAFSLRRVSSTEAFLLTGGEHSERAPSWRLWHSRDGARNWEAMTLPVRCTRALDIALAALADGFAWIDCQEEGPMTAPATLWQTVDAGEHWRQLPQPPLYRYSSDLVLVDRRHALVTSGGRADVSETRDGGGTWRSVLPYQEVGNGPVEPGPGGVLFSVLYQDDQAQPATSSLWRRAGRNGRWVKVVLSP